MSRMERQIQLNNLESVIEKKKREIQAKLEAQKKKETEDALIKIQKHSETPPRRPVWKSHNKDSTSVLAKAVEPSSKFTNVFSNDGSFLDQFRKLSKSGLKPDKVDVETLANARKADEKEKERRKIVEEEKNQRQIERNMRERERELKKFDRERDRRRSEPWARECSPKRAPLDANIKIELPPPGVVQLVPQVQLISPVVITALPQLVLNPPPPFTTNEIQLQATGIAPSSASLPPSLPHLPAPIINMLPVMSTPSLPSMSLPFTSPIATIPPPLPMTPYSIPPPSPIQVDSIPPPPSPPRGCYSPPTKKRKKREIAISSCALPPPGFCNEIPLPPSLPLPNEVPAAFRRDHATSSASLLDSGTRQLAKMIATSGDEAEDILRVAHKDDPALRFLFDVNSGKYKLFRNFIDACRSGNIDESDHESKPASDGESDSNKYDPADADDSDSSLTDKNEKKYDPIAAYDSDSCSSDKMIIKKEIQNDADFSSDSREPHFKMETKPTVQPNAMLFNSYKLENTNLDYDNISRPSFSGSYEVKSEENKSKITFVKSEPVKETKRERKSRWGDKSSDVIPPEQPTQPALSSANVPPYTIPVGLNPIMLHTVTRKDPGLLAYARQSFGSINLSDEDWKRAEDHYKINLLYQNMMKKREQLDKLAQQGKFKYEYDSDEETEGGTWEHKLRNQEMTATQLWADELTRQAEGKHHIGDFLPPEELDRFLEKYNAVKSGREPDLSDYKEFKLKEDNVGYKLLQKMGWNEGQGLGQEGQGMVNPVNKANTRVENQGLGLKRPDGVDVDDDEYSAYRKRMMLAYRFRPNPLNNPRRPYY